LSILSIIKSNVKSYREMDIKDMKLKNLLLFILILQATKIFTTVYHQREIVRNPLLRTSSIPTKTSVSIPNPTTTRAKPTFTSTQHQDKPLSQQTSTGVKAPPRTTVSKAPLFTTTNNLQENPAANYFEQSQQKSSLIKNNFGITFPTRAAIEKKFNEFTRYIAKKNPFIQNKKTAYGNIERQPLLSKKTTQSSSSKEPSARTNIANHDYTNATIKLLNQKNKENLAEAKKIIEAYEKIPVEGRPADINLALSRMKQGTLVDQAISSKNFSKILETTKLSPDQQTKLNSLLTGKTTPEKLRQELKSQDLAAIRDAYLNLALDHQWHLYKKALLNDKGFYSGSITIVEGSNGVGNFLENYVKLTNKNHDTMGRSFTSITSKDAYNRSNFSSHWAQQIEKTQQGNERLYGIDVTFDGSYNNLLPANRNQLHFGRLTNGRTFIKWESHGTTLNFQDASLIGHAKNYAITMRKLSQGKDLTAHRGENKIPNDVTESFNKLLTQKLSPEGKNIIKYEGISGMRKILRQQDLQNPENTVSYAQSFDDFLIGTKKYEPATLQYRKGNEVIFRGS